MDTKQLTKTLWHGDCSSLERLETNVETHQEKRLIPTKDYLEDLEPSAVADIYLRGMPKKGFLAAYGQRKKVIEAMIEEGSAKMDKWARQMADCCRYPTVLRNANGKMIISLGRCRHRMCGMCQVYRQREIMDKVMVAIRPWPVVRHLVLTLRSSEDDLGNQIDHLIKSFRRLRQRVEFKNHVLGGVGTIEVTRNPKTGKWHPHLHIMMSGKFWNQNAIASEWQAANGDSPICHISLVKDKRNAARYVAKYIAKPADIMRWPNTAITHYAKSLSGKRMMIRFGNVHRLTLLEREASEKPKGAVTVTSVLAIRRAYNAKMSFGLDVYKYASRYLPTLAKQIDYVRYKREGSCCDVALLQPDSAICGLCYVCDAWWGEGADPTSTSHIAKVRKKIVDSQMLLEFVRTTEDDVGSYHH